MPADTLHEREAGGVLGTRSAGLLAHVTSVPGGTLGDARRFVDWLASAGVQWWQVLPVGPPDEQGSPYRSASAFAGWPGLLSAPRAKVGVDEEDAFRQAQAAWIGDWEAYVVAGGGDGREAVRAQVRFEREWRALRAHAAEAGVRLIGDVPIYVAPGGADHTAHPELFRRGFVAGVPPDAFSDTGQRWGNPLFDWPAHRRQGYRWWIERFRRTFDLVDLTRIDHFRAFTAFWSVPESCPTAIEGRWLRGPGRSVFDAAQAELGPLPVIAEDLGVITPPVERLRDDLGFPGMVVVQFGFGADEPPVHHPANHPEDRVAYTGTHDHDTARGWWESLTPELQDEVDEAARACGLTPDRRRPWWTVVDLALASPARMAIVQLQDVLGLGADARMNTPGTDVGNWAWRATRRQLTPAVAARLRESIASSGRLAP